LGTELGWLLLRDGFTVGDGAGDQSERRR